MNQKNIAEIKRRLNPEKRHPTALRGCYVDNKGHIIAQFSTSVSRLPDGENEKYMGLFKKVLSGTLGQNLLPMSYDPARDADSEALAALMKLRDSALKDDAIAEAFYEKVIAGVMAEHADLQSLSDDATAANWVVLMLHDGYDVPYKNSNDETDADRSTDVFSYVLCSVCPVRQTKPALSYVPADSGFHDRIQDWVIGNPEVGFMYPAFEQRSADVYTALFYTRNSNDPHEGFLRQVFDIPALMPATEQRETFQAVLAASLAEECSLPVLQAVHGTVSAMMEEHAKDKTAAPLAFTRDDLRDVLLDCGVTEQKADVFGRQYDQAFGSQTVLPAVNTIAPKQFKVETPSISIKVDPAHTDLVQTRMIDGKCYLLIEADGDVEVNGMIVRVGGEQEEG